MSSESCRNELALQLTGVLSPEQLHSVLAAVDLTAVSYDIQRRSMDLIPYGGLPQAVNLFLNSKTVENLSAGTIYQYQRKLLMFFSYIIRPIQEISAGDIYAFLAAYKIERHVSDSTLDGTRRILNTFFTWLVDQDYLIKIPVAKVSKIKYQEAQRVPLDPIQLEQLRDNCVTLKEKALVEVFYSTGARVSEVAAMSRYDVNWQNQSITIRHGKGNKRRVVFFSPRAEFLLRKYLASRKDSDEALFAADRKRHPGRYMTAHTIQDIFKKIRQRQAVGAKCTPHVLCHTMATASLRAGMPLPNLQALLGHSKPETTMIYAHIDTSDLQQAHRRVYAG